MEEIVLKDPLDMHLHLREGEMLKNIIEYTTSQFAGAVVMPNLTTPITTTELALQYGEEITSNSKHKTFKPFLTLYITDSINEEELKYAKNKGIKILKIYPKGATTNSENGLNEILTPHMLKICDIAENMGFILSIHGETNGFSMDREYQFGKIFAKLAQDFPKLKIVIEHMSDHRSIELLETYPNIYATLTLHHITMTLDDMLGGALNAHRFCKPILKTPKDRDMLLNLALNAHPKVSFGSDSAPHLEKNKLKDSAAAGIFSSPMILCALATLFEKHNKLENLQAFISNNAKKIYNINDLQPKEIRLCKKHSWVPTQIKLIQNNIIPFNAGALLEWTQVI
ncbi:dihydroorotase [Helicobacter cappadocius]|uniref:Dihydroorotase n=1 Tax=Helicobacter cappadocius TaxID=3063998 RepID=A0AA90PXR3_9HELI|nr:MULTISPECIES: dihydroorotase [unclassified Helicobacter]MDO7252606.1 dihydroorotase [Helicobacter sp. faydin-H75]MDP2538473.1 dihydroorotase [Helicobacter sp. faydin-H76]